ncbi:hypothetical protein [Terriglobus saanensis]|uniref:hypothetical protein n=1 Tax=Terriglobus saanensis TaxID=870903 RepID=UPI001FDEE6BE|nr:hypothetical protein [Terriglobus saanensis]
MKVLGHDDVSFERCFVFRRGIDKDFLKQIAQSRRTKKRLTPKAAYRNEVEIARVMSSFKTCWHTKKDYREFLRFWFALRANTPPFRDEAAKEWAPGFF